MALSVPAQTYKDFLEISVILYGCETWSLNTDLKKRIDVFGARCLRRIIEYHWNDLVSNQRLLRETDSRPFTCIGRQRQQRLYGHVAPTRKPILLIALSHRGISQFGGG